MKLSDVKTISVSKKEIKVVQIDGKTWFFPPNTKIKSDSSPGAYHFDSSSLASLVIRLNDIEFCSEYDRNRPDIINKVIYEDVNVLPLLEEIGGDRIEKFLDAIQEAQEKREG